MTVLGIDPGTKRIGYALLSGPSLEHIEVLDLGLLPLENYSYSEIGRAYERLLTKWRPDVLAIERIFFGKNSKTAMAVAEVRGILKMLGRKRGLQIREYTPNELKQSITGYGLAKKPQVDKITQKLLKISRPMPVDDISDALAIALLPFIKTSYDIHT